MKSWWHYLKAGLSQAKTKDRLSSGKTPSGLIDKLKFFSPFLIKHWSGMVFGIVIIVLTTSVGYLNPLINRYLIDVVILDKKLNLLAVTILLLVLISLVQKVGSILQQFYFARFGRTIMLEIQSRLFEKVLHFPKSFFDDKETGYLMSRLSSDVEGLQWFFSSTIAYIFTNILSLVVGIGLMFYLEWRLAAVLLVMFPFLGFLTVYFSAKTKALSHQTMEQRANVMRRMQEALASIPLLKAFSTEKREAGKMKAELDKSYQLMLEQTAVQSLAYALISGLGDLSRLVTLVAGIPLIITGNWSLGSLYAFFSYQNYVINPVQFLSNLNMQLQNSLATLERIQAFEDVLPESHQQGDKKIYRLKGKIEFKEVTFSYDGKETILENVYFTVQPGEHIAIVGPSGIGKTTFVNLILRFYTPTKGEVYFDDEPASNYDLSSLRQRIGYVSQDIQLLSGTIAENLRYGNQSASEEEVRQAAIAAEIHTFIDSLPEGYQSKVGEKGVNFSEGQKQRISLARALVKNPDIIILDEPSSALDAKTESSIFESLPGILKGKTLIIITHRQATLSFCHKVLEYKDKQLHVL